MAGVVCTKSAKRDLRAADLLSLMSFLARQAIPEFILRSYIASQNTDTEIDMDVDLEPEEDLAILRV